MSGFLVTGRVFCACFPFDVMVRFTVLFKVFEAVGVFLYWGYVGLDYVEERWEGVCGVCVVTIRRG